MCPRGQFMQIFALDPEGSWAVLTASRALRVLQMHGAPWPVDVRDAALVARAISAARAERCGLAFDSPRPRSAIAASISTRRV